MTTNPRDAIIEALRDSDTLNNYGHRADAVLDALCPPGSRVVVDRTEKPCETCHGKTWLYGPEFEEVPCSSCDGSGVVEATTIHGLEQKRTYCAYHDPSAHGIPCYGPSWDCSPKPLYQQVALPEEKP